MIAVIGNIVDNALDVEIMSGLGGRNLAKRTTSICFPKLYETVLVKLVHTVDDSIRMRHDILAYWASKELGEEGRVRHHLLCIWSRLDGQRRSFRLQLKHWE